MPPFSNSGMPVRFGAAGRLLQLQAAALQQLLLLGRALHRETSLHRFLFLDARPLDHAELHGLLRADADLVAGPRLRHHRRAVVGRCLEPPEPPRLGPAVCQRLQRRLRGRGAGRAVGAGEAALDFGWRRDIRRLLRERVAGSLLRQG